MQTDPDQFPTDEALAELEAKLGTNFRNRRLLVQALTHRSYREEDQVSSDTSNERMEFLGDTILGMVIAEHLYRKFRRWSEGELTKLKAVVVSEASLAKAARGLGLGRFLRMGKGEELSGGRDRGSILADALEAMIGAVYLDRGQRGARNLVLKVLARELESTEGEKPGSDPKTILQEIAQEREKVTPCYRVVEESGPDHDKTFVVEVLVGGKNLGAGSGKSKKEAEQVAAREALKVIDRIPRSDQPDQI